MIYRTVISTLDEYDRLEFDALLGDSDAEAELRRKQTAAVLAAGGEIG